MTDLFAQKLLLHRIHVKQATCDADMVILALLQHLDDDCYKNIIMETEKRCVSISEIAKQLSYKMRECLSFTHAF